MFILILGSSDRTAFHLCLKLLVLLQFFISFGSVFQNLGPWKAIEFNPEFVLTLFCLSRRSEFLVLLKAFAGVKISLIYLGDFSLRYLWTVEHIICLTRSSTGSQLILLKLWLFRCDLECICRQNLMHLFWQVCSLCFRFLFRLGEPCTAGIIKCGCIRALQRSLRR